jgi:hypothetical protein
MYQLIAFGFLFLMSFQLMKAKEFCHSLFDTNLNSPLLHMYRAAFHPRFQGESLQLSKKGVSFHRVITNFPDNSEFLLSFEKEESYCEAIDEFGANNCHFNWREEVVGNFSTAISQQLDEESSLQADLVLEGHIPYRINCALCGQPCKIGLPIIHFEYSLHMPPCPVDLSNHSQDFHYQLWKHSPTEGMVSISVEGNAVVYSSPGKKLAEFEVSGAIQ